MITRIMLKVKFTNVSEWKAVLNAIGDIVEDAMFICNDDGITFRGIDPAHVALIDVSFPKSAFVEFNSQTSFFGLKVDDFKNVINTAGNNDLVELQIADQGSMKILINGSLKMEYTLKLLERTEVNTPLPKIDVKSKITLSPTVFGKIISNIEKISDYLTINCQSDKIEFFGKGDIGEAKIDLEKTNPELELLNVSEDSSSVYSIDYMAKIIRSVGRECKNVNMEYGTQTPIHMKFQLPSLASLEYYLAPRIE